MTDVSIAMNVQLPVPVPRMLFPGYQLVLHIYQKTENRDIIKVETGLRPVSTMNQNEKRRTETKNAELKMKNEKQEMINE